MSLHNTPKSGISQETKGLFPFWKKPGETLAVMLRRFRTEHNVSLDEKVTYAGRLDPMAEGVVPILTGPARFQKELFMKKTKTYEVEILLGIGTDTGDMLGLSCQSEATAELGISARKFLAEEIEKALAMLAKTVSLPYPNYSSRPVDGKPLFMHARAGNQVILPIKKVSVYELELLEIKEYKISDLVAKALSVIETVQGDFRQGEIIKLWNVYMARSDLVQVVTIRTTVSSGTYMRALAEKLGLLLKAPALAYSIKRVAIAGIQ
jgi:tRNA pseudouridine(55) synthase